MNAPMPLHAPHIAIDRTGLLAAASAVLATCSIAVTLAVASGGGGSGEPAAAAGPRFATGITASDSVDHGAMERRR